MGVNHCRDVTSPGRASFTPGIRNGSGSDRLLTFPHDALALVRDRSVKTTAYRYCKSLNLAHLPRSIEESESKKNDIKAIYIILTELTVSYRIEKVSTRKGAKYNYLKCDLINE